MEFAADAVVDLIAPQPRARAETARDDNEFAQHLEAAQRCAAPETTAPEKPDRPAASDAAPTKDPEQELDAVVAGQIPRCAETSAEAPKAETAAPPPVLVDISAFIQTLKASPPPATNPAAAAVEALRNWLADAASGESDAAAAAATQTDAAGPRSCATDAAPVAPRGAPETKPSQSKQDAPALLTAPATGNPEAAIAAAVSMESAATAPAPSAAARETPAPIPPVVTPPIAAAPRSVDVRQGPRVEKADVLRGEAKNEASAAKGNANGAAVKPQGRSAPLITSEGVAFALVDAPETAAANPQTLANALSFSAAHAGQAQHAVLDQGAARAAPAAAQVAREIVRRFDGESTRFEVRLDPPELGRVEVRLEVSRDHRVTAVVAADSPQALTELARHARELEQSLQSAGLELADNGLSFDLRQSGDDAEQTRGGASRGGDAGVEDTNVEAPLTARLERWRGVRVDVMV